MTMRMLIDARHREETRVAVVTGNRIEEFDFESAEHKQLKGNIYLAKVTRVEPSLQAAFVDYGGNRHGFLAFSEIHPDYYQIPREDREALLAEEAQHAAEEAALRADEDDDEDHAGSVEEVERPHDDEDEDGEAAGDGGDEDGEGARASGRERNGDQAEELRRKRMALRRRYKIQDVIRRRQVLLVQVVKEERGNKGAALTTYLSLAGRYCVLMPNSSHGGGISRKINSATDRKRLKQIVGELSLPRSMGMIVRTAGLQRTKTEIKRDFDYLARLWDEIREKTLGSSAPAMIHSDSDLIKRAIRDIYNRDIEEVVVEGGEGYKAAREFMKLLMPSHARRVKQYADPVPLFQRYGAEDQLSAMYDPVVQLKSGGYLVINPTEALVSIDINSGRSTKEHGIEQTALNTNLEAAREIARHLRLRDMAGLVVIDFIDMEYGSNVRKVEKAMKEALKNDRARIQVGRISGFGLMEMSRQRLRTGVLEATTRGCPHCDGTGLVRTASSAGLSALRLIEDEAAKGKGTTITLYASTEAAVYLLNAKRADLAEIEERYGVIVEVLPEGEEEGAKMRVTSTGPRPASVPRFETLAEDEDDDVPLDEDENEGAEDEEDRESADQDGERNARRRRRRRGGRRRGRSDEREDTGENAEHSAEEQDDSAPEEDAEAGETSEDHGERPKKRRRRGGRRRRRSEDGEGDMSETAGFEGSEAAEEIAETIAAEVSAEPETLAEEVLDEAPAPKRRTRRRKADTVETPEPDAEAAPAPAEPAPAEPEAAEEAPKPKRTRRKKAEPAQAEPAQAEPAPAEAAEPAPEPEVEPKAAEAEAAPSAEEEAPKPKRTRRKKAEPAPAETEAPPADPVPANDANGEAEPARPRRTGWWQRTFGE